MQVSGIFFYFPFGGNLRFLTKVVMPPSENIGKGIRNWSRMFRKQRIFSS
jgi:hypothetical protein